MYSSYTKSTKLMSCLFGIECNCSKHTCLTANCFFSWYIIKTDPFPPFPILEVAALSFGSGYLILPRNRLSHYIKQALPYIDIYHKMYIFG